MVVYMYSLVYQYNNYIHLLLCRYGMKIRLPHSLVMTFLFQEGT